MVRRMTADEKVATVSADRRAEGAWRAELVDTIRLAAPMALTQLGQVSMMTTDLMLLGRLGDKVVAAAALAHTVLFVGFTLGMGFMQAVAPLAAQAFGARQPRLVPRALLHLPGTAQLHERGQPARARPVDHAGGHSGQRPSRLCPDLRGNG